MKVKSEYARYMWNEIAGHACKAMMHVCRKIELRRVMDQSIRDNKKHVKIESNVAQSLK